MPSAAEKSENSLLSKAKSACSTIYQGALGLKKSIEQIGKATEVAGDRYTERKEQLAAASADIEAKRASLQSQVDDVIKNTGANNDIQLFLKLMKVWLTACYAVDKDGNKLLTNEVRQASWNRFKGNTIDTLESIYGERAARAIVGTPVVASNVANAAVNTVTSGANAVSDLAGVAAKGVYERGVQIKEGLVSGTKYVVDAIFPKKEPEQPAPLQSGNDVITPEGLTHSVKENDELDESEALGQNFDDVEKAYQRVVEDKDDLENDKNLVKEEKEEKEEAAGVVAQPGVAP